MNIKIDFREIKRRDIFVVLRGINDDVHKYVKDVIKNGATTVIVKDINEYSKEYLENNYYDEIKKLKLIEKYCFFLLI